MFDEFLIKKFFQSCSAWQNSHRCVMHLLLSVLRTIFLIRFSYVKSIASTDNPKFWWALQMQTKWVISEPARPHHLCLKAQNSESPIFTFGCFSLKAVYNSCKLQKILQVPKLLIIYSFTHTNIVFLFRHYGNYHLHKHLLPDKVFQWW